MPESTTGPTVRERRAELSKNLFRAHHDALIRALLPILRDEDECRDVAQQAHIRMFELQTPDVINYHQAYLFRVARNLAEDRRRQLVSRRRIDAQVLFHPEPVASPDRVVQAREELALVSRAIEELPPLCRAVFLLVQWEELTVVDAAKRVGIRPWTARRLVARALEHCLQAVQGARANKQGVSR